MSDYDDIDILLVEDNPQDAEMTLRALKKSNIGNKVHWARDGVEALDFVRCTGEFTGRDPHRAPKLILLDLKMPRLDGLDVLRALKSQDKTRSIPIVAMTSSNQEKDLAESYRLGVNGYVTKPLEIESFIDTVGKIGVFWLSVNQTAP